MYNVSRVTFSPRTLCSQNKTISRKLKDKAGVVHNVLTVAMVAESNFADGCNIGKHNVINKLSLVVAKVLRVFELE